MSLRLTFAPWGESLAELVEVSRQAEAAGAEIVWVPEMHRSATVTAAAVAAGTSTLGLGTGVQRVNEDWYNAQWGKPVAHLRESINVIRTFIDECTTGEPMTVEGEYEHLKVKGYQRTYHRERNAIPIYLAGVGPVMVRLAGETAQGWISHELCSPRYVTETILPNITEGLAKSGRDRSDIELVVSACAAVDEDGAKARRLAAGVVGFYATVRTYADFFAFHGFAEDQQKIVDAFRAGGVTAQKLGDLVPDPMVQAFTISGTRDDVATSINAYDGIVDAIKLSPPTSGLAPEQTRAAQQQLLAVVA